MLYTGLTTTTALNSMLLQSAQPALILMIGALMMKDRTGLRQIVGVVISLAGVLTVVSRGDRSEEHTSELQSLMRISYAVFCLKKKKLRETKKRTQTKTQ